MVDEAGRSELIENPGDLVGGELVWAELGVASLSHPARPCSPVVSGTGVGRRPRMPFLFRGRLDGREARLDHGGHLSDCFVVSSELSASSLDKALMLFPGFPRLVWCFLSWSSRRSLRRRRRSISRALRGVLRATYLRGELGEGTDVAGTPPLDDVARVEALSPQQSSFWHLSR